jgi:uncharacterized protein (TIGR00730 family)
MINSLTKVFFLLQEGEMDIGTVTVVESMHERKNEMAKVSDAFVALPGGFGTLDELVEIITWVHNCQSP